MSVISHDGKVVIAGGKSLSFDNLISMANETTGQSDTTLTDAVQSLVDGFGGGGGNVYEMEITLAADGDLYTSSVPESTQSPLLTAIVNEIGGYPTAFSVVDTSGTIPYEPDKQYIYSGIAGNMVEYEVYGNSICLSDTRQYIYASGSYSYSVKSVPGIGMWLLAKNTPAVFTDTSGIQGKAGRTYKVRFWR